MPERRQTAERKTSYERTEWRAVGYDLPVKGDHAHEYGEWQDDREAAEADLVEMRASLMPYDDAWLEVRMVTATAPQRVDMPPLPSTGERNV